MSVSTMEPQRCIPRPPSPLYGGGPASPQAPGANGNGKDFTERTLRSLKVSLGKLWRRRSVTITEYDPVYKCAYLGNVLTGWAKGEGCVEKPLSTLWKNYTSSSKPDVQMKVTVTQSGLKAVTKEHGLTEYWSHRVTYCAAPAAFPRIFCWVYRHEGRKLKQELRCHAVLCSKEAVAKRMATQLRSKLAQALLEFKRDKVCRQNARLSLANSVYDNPSLPRRKILLSTGSHNYRPPLERSKSAPKLMAIEESLEEDDDQDYKSTHSRFLQRINSVPLAKEEIKHLSPEHISRIFQRVSVISGEKSVSVPEVVLHEDVEDDQDDRRYEEVYVGERESSPANSTSEQHVFDVQPVTEDGLGVPEMSERRFSKSPLVRRNSIKRVGWAVEPDRRRYSNSYNNERLLVLGKEDEEEVEECTKVMADELGESDENSLQSISSSGSGSSDTSSARRNQENTKRQYPGLPYMYQETEIIGGQHSNSIIYHELQRGIQESHRGYVDGQNGQHDADFDDVIEFRPMGETDDMLLELDSLKNTFRRSATFPPPSQDPEELLLLDSLSDEDIGKEDDETESDESGYVESTEKDYLKPEDKDKNTPQRQIIKSILRPTNRNSQCVQV